jgi:aspartyl protease family protein
MNSEAQNLVYLLILLSFLLSSLYMSRGLPLLQTIKYIAIWGVIALFGVALYAYRFEFSDFKDRIISEIDPSLVRLNGNKIVINLSQDGHFYLNTKINGKVIRFMIDTGASDVALNLQDAKAIGINLKDLVFDKRYNTANGVVLGASVRLDEIEVASVKFYDIKASVNQGELDVSLLGMSFLREFRRYEFYRDKLILEI